MQRNICVHILHKFNQTLLLHFFHSYDDDDDDDDDIDYHLNLKSLRLNLQRLIAFKCYCCFVFLMGFTIWF